MLEQSILEAAGYEVELATSGEEALEKARRARYAVFVVDVEMPGMNGFELLERFRADPALATTPAILVTSRATPDDRRRGEAAGARAHIDKGAFDAGHLLRAIRGLTGEGPG
jgi:two-component system chemotaxis sensor kinase CheA